MIYFTYASSYKSTCKTHICLNLYCEMIEKKQTCIPKREQNLVIKFTSKNQTQESKAKNDDFYL